jgi:hypothetical protein
LESWVFFDGDSIEECPSLVFAAEAIVIQLKAHIGSLKNEIMPKEDR